MSSHGSLAAVQENGAPAKQSSPGKSSRRLRRKPDFCELKSRLDKCIALFQCISKIDFNVLYALFAGCMTHLEKMMPEYPTAVLRQKLQSLKDTLLCRIKKEAQHPSYPFFDWDMDQGYCEEYPL